MKVAIDASCVRIASTGISRYTLKLTEAIRRVCPDVELVEIAYEPRFSRSRRLLRVWDTLYRERVWMPYVLGRLAREAGADLLHIPGSRMPTRCPLPVICTICDVYAFRQPQDFTWWNQHAERYFTPRCVAHADHLISISAFTRQELCDLFGAGVGERTTAILLGVDDGFQAAPDEQCKEVLTRLGVTAPYVLGVSTIEPRKNFLGSLRAFAAIRDRVPHQYVVAGGLGWKYQPIVDEVRVLGLEDRVQFLGFVEDEDLPPLFTKADLFLYPSLYEGFGLPVVEAMACGCPVVTSNRASLPEVVKDAAVMVDPDDTDALAAAMQSLLGDAKRRDALREAGRVRAAELNWDRTALATAAVYRQVLETRGRS